MIDALRPWVGAALGVMLMITGAQWVLKPQPFVGVGYISARDPRTVRVFGIAVFLIGALNASLNVLNFFSE